MSAKNHQSIIRMTEFAILTAIVLLLHFSGIGIRLPFLGTPISLTLIPIALGAMILGPWAGFALGLIYGLVVFITYGVMGMDPVFTAVLFANNPIATCLICTLKTSLAGLVAGLVFKGLQQKNSLWATILASALVPVINTGIFIVGGLFIADTLKANFVAEGSTVIYFLVVGVAGINFIFVFLVNTVFSPALHRLVTVLKKRIF